MKEFWKNEWELFLDDMEALGEFFLQPVTITTSYQKLNPSIEERSGNVQVQDVGIWNNFKQGCAEIKEFLFQPVKFTL